MPQMDENLALTLALAESEIKRKQAEGTVAQARSIITQQQETIKEQAEKIEKLSAAKAKAGRKRGPYKSRGKDKPVGMKPEAVASEPKSDKPNGMPGQPSTSGVN